MKKVAQMNHLKKKMKRLVLAEKPSVARDLSKILGADQKHKNYYEGKSTPPFSAV